MSQQSLPETTSGDGLVRRIATALRIPVDAFYNLPQRHVFHVGSDGTQWILKYDSTGSPTVSRATERTGDSMSDDEDVIVFLIQNFDSPQGKALAGIICQSLSIHLPLNTRS